MMNKVFAVSKKRLTACVAVVLIALLFVGGLLGLKFWENRSVNDLPQTDAPTTNDRAEIYVNGEKYAVNDQVEAVLFLGIDSYDGAQKNTYMNGQQADLLMLLVLDHGKQAYTAIQINRDTITSFETLGVTGESSGMSTAQIALSHAYGTGAADSSRNTTKAVSKLLYGVKIPHFATIRMSAITKLNDAVGGVTLELLDDFTMLREDFTKGSMVTLLGDQATAYVQYRGQLEDSTNISRMARQKQYMSAWVEAFESVSEQDDQFVARLALNIADDLTSDLTAEQLNTLSLYFSSYTSNGIVDLAGESVKGEEYTEFHVDEDALQQQVLELFYTRVE